MEDDDDYIPDFLKEDSVVESPFSLDDMVMPSDYEWTHLNDDFSVEGILKLNKEGKNQGLNLTGNQMWALDKIKDNLYNWDDEPEFSDIFHKEFCKKYGISLSILRTLERKGLIKLSKDDYYFKERGYIVYPKPLMYLVYISNQDYPDWFIRGSKEMGLWKAESFEARGYAPDKPFYATTHENAPTTVMHPIKCGHYKMVMNGTGVWMSPTFYDTIEEMFTDKFDEIMDTQAEGMIDYLDTEIGQETKRKYQAIKTIGDARKFAKRHFDFKIDFAPCFRKERDYDSKALNALPITVAPIYDEDYFDAESKKMNPLEKAGISGMASGATMEGLETLMAAEGQGFEYYFLVDDDGKVTNDFSSLEEAQIARSYVPHKNLKIMRRRFEGRNMTGKTTEVREFDPYSVPNYFKNNYHSEEEELSKEQLSAYFARLKNQNPDLAKEIEYSVKEQSYLPRVDINKAGFDDDIIEAWVDLVAVEDDKYAPFERCDECEGEGYVLTSYTSATRFEPADGDGEDCSYCEGTGEIDPAEYMYSNDDGKVGYLAENAETKLSKTSCCCGADEANPCVCMKAPEPMECSAKAPKCACYKALEKNAEFLYYYVLNEKGESPADFNTLEEAQTYVANSSEPLEIYERRSRDDEAYKMDKKMNAEYDEEDMVFCNHCSDIVGNEKEVYGDETVEYEMANGELVCIPCHKIWMKEYKNDLDPHYSPFYAESFIKSHYVWGVGIFALTLGLLSRKR